MIHRQLEEREKRALRRALDTRKPFDLSVGPKDLTVKRERDFLTETKPGYKPGKLKGRSGTRLSPEKRAMVELRRTRRAEFFASLRGE